MAYNYYDNFSAASHHNHSNKSYHAQQNNSYYHEGTDFQANNAILRNNQKNMLSQEGHHNPYGGPSYYPNHQQQHHHQPLMAMMVVDSSPSSPSSNSQEGGRGHFSKQRLHTKKKNITDKSSSYSNTDNASGDGNKSLSRAIRNKRVKGMAGPSHQMLKSAADEEYLTTKKVSAYPDIKIYV